MTHSPQVEQISGGGSDMMLLFNFKKMSNSTQIKIMTTNQKIAHFEITEIFKNPKTYETLRQVT